MPTTYSECDPEDYGLMQALIDEFRPDLTDAGVSIKLMFASNEDGPAIKHHGHAADGLAKINSLKDRAEGKTDCTITLDRDRWGEMTDRQRRALLHHELHHFKATEKEDDLGRPVVKLREHDWEFGGFDGILQLYREASAEWRFIEDVSGRRDQLMLPGMAGAAELGLGDDVSLSVNGQPVPKGREVEVIGEAIEESMGGKRRRPAASAR